MYYLLDEDGETPIKTTVDEWAVAFEDGDRVVEKTKFENDIVVSTVFLGLDHSSLVEDSDPVLWETMVFDLPSEIAHRYTSLKDAKEGHKDACALVEDILKNLKGSKSFNEFAENYDFSREEKEWLNFFLKIKGKA